MAPIKATGKVEAMYGLQIQDLHWRLTELKVPFKLTDRKSRLQALLALFNLGIIKQGGTSDQVEPGELENLLSKVGVFCKMLVRDQLETIRGENLDPEGCKWDHVEVLTRAELKKLGTAITQLAELGIGDAPLENLSVVSNVAVVNMLITSIYAETARSHSTVLLPKCPIKGDKAVLRHLNNITPIGNPEQLQAAMTLKSEPAILLSWICTKFGLDYIQPEGDLHIDGLSANVQQFVSVNPCKALQNRFETFMAKYKPRKSIILWHGTDLRFLRSIIVNGFAPAADKRFGSGVFMADKFQISEYYAMQYIRYDHPLMVNRLFWKHSPFENYGVMLGCEVAGWGRPVLDHPAGVHVITDLGSAMVRYIFLLPPHGSLSKSKTVETQILAAFGLLDQRYYRRKAENSS